MRRGGEPPGKGGFSAQKRGRTAGRRFFPLFHGEAHGEGGALAGNAVHLHSAVVVEDGVLDDGQPQPGAAGRLGVALVYPVEPLEYAALVLRGDADAGVGHGDHRVAAVAGDGDGDGAAVAVVLDGVVAEVGEYLADETADAGDRCLLAADGDGHVMRLRRRCQRLRCVAAQGEKLHRLRGQCAALVQL